MGHFYDSECLLSPDTCGCTIARDSSLSGEDHRLSAQFVTQCAEHAKAGSTAVEVHQHNVAKNITAKVISEAFPGDEEPVEYILSPMTGKIAIRHSKADATVLAAVAKALEDHPVANLSLADDAISQEVFTAKDGAVLDGKPIFWDLDKDGKAEIAGS